MEKTMNDYILETPSTILNNLKKSKSLTQDLVNLYLEKDYKDICIIASGSSYNAAMCARWFMRELLKKDVKVITPYTFENYEFNTLEDSFTIVISQSGCSTNSINALKKLTSIGKPAIGVTGNIESDFKDVADYVIDYGVGIETVGYVTKGVVSLAAYLMLFSLEVTLKQGHISSNTYQSYLNEIELTTKAHGSIYQSTKDFIENNYKNLSSMDKVYICSCGPNYGTALEGALKIGETVHIPAIAYEFEEFLHGPDFQLTPTYTVFFIDNHDHTSNRVIDIYNATRHVTDNAYIVTNNKNIDDKHAVRCDIPVSNLVSPLYNLVVFELIAYRITEDLNTWKKHPLFYDFSKRISSKSESYQDNEV